LLSAFAHGGGELIAFRAITGIGGALIMPGTLSTITSVFPPDERARAVGIWAGFAGRRRHSWHVGRRWMLGHFAWTSIFYLTAIVAARRSWRSWPSCPTPARVSMSVSIHWALSSRHSASVDWCSASSRPDPGWSDPVTVAGLAVGILLGAAFVLWELRVEHPLLDPGCPAPRLRHRLGVDARVVPGAVGTFLVILQYLQLVLGYSPLKSAVAFAADDGGDDPHLGGGRSPVDALRSKLVGGSGLAISALGSLGFATLTASSGFVPLLVAQLILALGVGLAMTPATNAIVASLPTAKQGVASAVNDTTREIGTALGIAIMGSMFNTGYRNGLIGHLGGVPKDAAAQARQAPGSRSRRLTDSVVPALVWSPPRSTRSRVACACRWSSVPDC